MESSSVFGRRVGSSPTVGCPENGFLWFPIFTSRQMPGQFLFIGHSRFLPPPYPISFTIIHFIFINPQLRLASGRASGCKKCHINSSHLIPDPVLRNGNKGRCTHTTNACKLKCSLIFFNGHLYINVINPDMLFSYANYQKRIGTL